MLPSAGPHLLLLASLLPPLSCYCGVSIRRNSVRRSCSPQLSADDDLLMASLLQRMGDVQEAESARQLESMVAAASNWRTGKCKQRTIAVLDEWARRVRMEDGRLAVGTYGGDVLLIDAASGETLRCWQDEDADGDADEITALGFDGERIITGSSRGAVLLRRAGDDEDGEPVLRASHRGAVSGVHWPRGADGGRHAYSCGLDGRLVCHDVESGREEASLSFRPPVFGLSVGDNYAALALGDGTVALCSLLPLRELFVFEAHPGAATTAVHLVTPSQLVTGSSSGELRLWRLDEEGDSERRCTAFDGHEGAVVCLQGDGEKVVSGGRDGSVRVWAAESGRMRFMLQGFTAYLGSLQLAPTWLLADGMNNAVLLVDFCADDAADDADE